MIHLILTDTEAREFLRYLYRRPLQLVREPIDDVLYRVVDQLEDKLDIPDRAPR